MNFVDAPVSNVITFTSFVKSPLLNISTVANAVLRSLTIAGITLPLSSLQIIKYVIFAPPFIIYIVMCLCENYMIVFVNVCEILAIFVFYF